MYWGKHRLGVRREGMKKQTTILQVLSWRSAQDIKQKQLVGRQGLRDKNLAEKPGDTEHYLQWGVMVKKQLFDLI